MSNSKQKQNVRNRNQAFDHNLKLDINSRYKVVKIEIEYQTKSRKTDHYSNQKLVDRNRNQNLETGTKVQKQKVIFKLNYEKGIRSVIH